MTLLCFLDLLPCIAFIYTYHHARERGGVLQTPFAVQEHRLKIGTKKNSGMAFSQSTTTATSATCGMDFPPAPHTLSLRDPVQSFRGTIYQCQLGPLQGRIQNGDPNLALVKDPFSTAHTPVSSLRLNFFPVMQVQYSAGNCEDYIVGSAQFYARWKTSGSAFQSMLVRYKAAFDPGLIRV